MNQNNRDLENVAITDARKSVPEIVARKLQQIAHEDENNIQVFHLTLERELDPIWDQLFLLPRNSRAWFYGGGGVWLFFSDGDLFAEPIQNGGDVDSSFELRRDSVWVITLDDAAKDLRASQCILKSYSSTLSTDEREIISQRSMYDDVLTSFHRIVKPLMSTLIVDDSQRKDLVLRCANDVGKSSGQKPFTSGEMERLLSTEWERLAKRYEQGLRGDVLFAPDKPNEFQSFYTRCPFCGTSGGLDVTQVAFSNCQGLVVDLCVPLEEDGFDLSHEVPCSLRYCDLSTQDERVSCRRCGQTFELSLVTVG